MLIAHSAREVSCPIPTSFGALVEQSKSGLQQFHIQVWVWSENEHWKSSDQFRQVQTGRQIFRCAIFSVDVIFPWRCRQKNHHVRSPPWVLYSTRLWFRTVVIVYTCFFIQTIKVDKQMFQMCQAKIYCFYHQKYGQIKATIDLVNNIKLTSCYCKL